MNNIVGYLVVPSDFPWKTYVLCFVLPFQKALHRKRFPSALAKDGRTPPCLPDAVDPDFILTASPEGPINIDKV
jgi:hypothetical protein